MLNNLASLNDYLIFAHFLSEFGKSLWLSQYYDLLPESEHLLERLAIFFSDRALP